MRNLRLKHLAVAACLIIALPALFTACAKPQPKAEVVSNHVVYRAGETVRLFHGGTKEAKAEFCVGETIPVYRWIGHGRYVEYKQVGKAKITKLVGEHYFDATIVEGEARHGDVVKKASSACLVVPMEAPEKPE